MANSTLMRINWLELKRDRVALGVVFILPIVFFSIFAWIFGGTSGGASGTKTLKVLVANQDGTRFSDGLIRVLDERKEIRVVRAASGATELDKAGETTTPRLNSVDDARSAVRSGKYDAALIIPEGFGDAFPDFAAEGPTIKLIYDSSNPIAQPSIVGLMQAAAFQSAPDALMSKGIDVLEDSGLQLTDDQLQIVERVQRLLAADAAAAESTDDAAPSQDDAGGFGGGISSFVRVDASAARSEGDIKQAKKRKNQIISYYVAGIGVMFMLFSTSGAAGTLLEEEENGTLDRLLSSQVSMNQLLASHWTFYALMAIVQMALMFLWGKFVFGLELFTPNRLAGATAMTVVTSFAASAFGMLLATLCRTRAQLGGISTIVILVMSALGGSMVPRFVMPAALQTSSKFTFNGWAIDGFLKVFWYDDPSDSVLASLAKLWPQLLVLGMMAIGFMATARILAKRWEAQ